MVNRKEDGTFLSNEEEKIKKAISDKYNGSFEYAGGYSGSDGHLNIECKCCGHVFKYNAQIIRPSRNRKIVCRNCTLLKKQKQKQFKKEQLESVKRQKELEQLKELTKECLECGEVFIATHRGKKYCSDRCRCKKSNRTKEMLRRVSLVKNGTIDSSVTLTKLIKKDKGVCKICGKKVNTKDFHRTEEGYFISGNSYPSIDHILPVAKGGTHTWDNVQLAHRGCNSVKGDSVNNPIQLKLFS